MSSSTINRMFDSLLLEEDHIFALRACEVLY